MKNFLLFISFTLTVALLFQTNKGQAIEETGLADTPWPMYRHDPQRTGRSPLLGPTQKPELLWTYQLDNCGIGGGISIDEDGNLIISHGGCLDSFNPISRQRNWHFPNGALSASVPLIDIENNIYWGYALTFAKISPNGEIIWQSLLGLNFFFNSSPTFGTDGNVYVIHDALWSFTPSGESRWVFLFSDFAGSSPAIGQNGLIHFSDYYDLTAVNSDGQETWSVDTEYVAKDVTSAIASDGTIYLPSGEGMIYAINPDGTIKWNFQPSENIISALEDLLAIAPDGSIYFPLHTPDANLIYAITNEGQFKWKIDFPANPITTFSAYQRYPILTDNAGNVFICPENSRCYGIDPQGEIMWEFEFTLEDSIEIVAGTQPILADNGLLYIYDNKDKLYVFADSSLYPILQSPTNHIELHIEPNIAPFTITVPISASVSSITYTASITDVNWINLLANIGTTPSEVMLQIDPSTLSAGIYDNLLQIKALDLTNKWLQIPIKIFVGIKQTYLPIITEKPSYQLIYSSALFHDIQLATVDLAGKNREVLLHNFGPEMNKEFYSPDGLKMAGPNSQGQIAVYDLTNGQEILQINIGDNTSPTWAPDSNRLAFWSNRDEPNNGEIYTINLDGTGLARLTYNEFHEQNLIWSPAGDKIAFSNLADTIIINANGDNLEVIDSGNYLDFPISWSPDGRYLLTSSQTPTSNSNELWVYDTETATHSFLADNLIFSNGYEDQAMWSPEGAHIAYIVGDYKNTDIYIMNKDGTKNIQATNIDGRMLEMAWSPDGQWLAMTHMLDYKTDLYIVGSDGSDFHKLTTNLGGDGNPFWRPRR